MKYVYHFNYRTACITAVLLICNITGMNRALAQAMPDYSKAGYVPVNMGKIMPNETYADNTTRLPEPVAIRDLIITPSNDGNVLQWRTTWEPDNLKLYEIEYSSDSINFQQVGVITAGNYRNGKTYEFRHYAVNARDRLFYRIRITDKNGRYDYSQILTLAANGTTQNYIFPTIVNAGRVSVYLKDSFKRLQIVNTEGRILLTLHLNGKIGRTDIPVDMLSAGIYFVRVLGENRQKDIVQKIFIQ